MTPQSTSLRLVLWLLALGFLLPPLRAEEKITYTDHVLPLVEANCARCHNADKKKADLDLTSYQGTLKGSGSGAVVVSGNPDGSKLWKAITHAEDPLMPPNRPKLADKDLEVFRKWILGGLLETADGKAVAAAKPAADLALKADDVGKAEGPPPMPKDLPLEPVIHSVHMNAITGLAASPWAPLIAVAGQKQVLLFDSDTLELLGILPFGEGQPVEVKFSRNGKLLLASGGRGARSGRVVVWDVVTGAHLMSLGEEYDTILTADIRPDQSQIALGGPSRLVKLYSTQSGQLQHKIKKHTDWVTALAFSPNGTLLATADRNGGISVWDPDNAQELFTLAGHKSAVTALSWRSDSKLLASSSEDGTVKLWEMQEGKQAKSWTAHGSGALFASYSRDGGLVTCGRDNAVTQWNGSGAKVRAFEAFCELPLRAVFSHDGKRVFATDFAGHLGVWNTADGKRVGALDLNPLPLADQLAAAERRVAQLLAPEARSEGDNKALDEAKSSVTRLKKAQILTSAYTLRESLAGERREQDRLKATITTDTDAIQKAKKQLAAARESAAKAEADLANARNEMGKTVPLANRLAGEIKAGQTELDRLLEQWRNLDAVTNAPSAGSMGTRQDEHKPPLAQSTP